MALLNPPGDPIGWAYIVVAVLGYFFIQTRGLTTFLWLLVAAGGAAVALAGNPSGWVELALGLGLAGVAVTPLALAYRMPPANQRPAAAFVVAQSSANGHTSAFLEDPLTRTSGKLEESEASMTTTAAGPVPTLRRLSIRSIGRLRLTAGNQDLAADLEDHPVLAFLFMYLLARAVLGERPARSALGDELSPGVTETSQKERLRKQLYELQKGTAPEVAALIRSQPHPRVAGARRRGI